MYFECNHTSNRNTISLLSLDIRTDTQACLVDRSKTTTHIVVVWLEQQQQKASAWYSFQSDEQQEHASLASKMHDTRAVSVRARLWRTLG
jgi:nanoRNase/pAp phosphatase (c-di-AMP/oligoRNAs hydrolase)